MIEESAKTKVLAMYLPQYHEIPENNEWWGKGFTEWTNVKKSKPLYRGHEQPKIPFDGNYYDLSDKNVMRNQMKLAKKYGVDGFCIYHYWFNGKKLLEKPLEDLLTVDDLELSFCICWANEAWSRTWDGMEGSKILLMPQEYGGEDEWERHFQYLLQFFRHKNYIKVDEKPVIVIYNSAHIEKRKEMLKKWDDLAVTNGFPGVFVINIRRNRLMSEAQFWGDEIADFEPHATLNHLVEYEREQISNTYRGNRRDNRKYLYHVIDYKKFCDYLVSRYAPGNEGHNLGMFVGWDNTPRRGIETQLIFENNTPDVFEQYFEIQYKRSIERNNKFLFINAWNEWGEGTYLEPDVKNKMEYLEAVKRVKNDFCNY